MKTDLDHLPARKQRELGRVVEILHEEFEDALRLALSARKKRGRILKIILFGSYARGGWVDEPHTAKGYMSDYDLLVIVNDKKLKDVADYWYKAEDRLIHEPAIKTPVNFVVHTLDEVNNALAQGQYFFSDIKKDGIALYDLKGHTLAEAKVLTAEEAHDIAAEHFETWFTSAEEFFDDFERNVELRRTKKAAFYMHQATENLYACLLLVLTNYSPATHNIKCLRSLAEDIDARLRDVWPADTRLARRSFELLKQAYVKARYSKHYKITEEELTWLGERVEKLQALAKEVCEERLAELEQNAMKG